MAFKIYTKTGDEGLTGLLGGTRVPKSHIRIESYGTIDELNAHLGFCSDLLSNESSIAVIRNIQHHLFVIGAHLATDNSKSPAIKLPVFDAEAVLELENAIDAMDEKLPSLKSFIIPGGNKAASALHIARCVCRRAERICVQLQLEKIETDPLFIKYLNRLSDFLFTLARYTGWQAGMADREWHPDKSKG